MKETKAHTWLDRGGRLYLSSPIKQQGELQNAVYEVSIDENHNYFLVKREESFHFDYKIYGLEESFVKRVLKTYESTTHGNVGVLCNGLKGTGKTVTSKIICNKLEQPVIIVSNALPGVEKFLNSIPQNITIFIDEYEKIFGESKEMLTIMDGALNSTYRRVFMLTTNKLYIDDNLLDRPSRIRYLNKFEDLAPRIVEEIVDDVLEHKDLKDDVMKFIPTLAVITVDIVKAVLSEVNIHNESPFVFQDVFNVKKNTGKFSIFEVMEDGTPRLIADKVNLDPRPKYSENHVGYWFNFGGRHIGKISEVNGPNAVTVQEFDEDEEGNRTLVNTWKLCVEEAYGTHSNYAYDEYGVSQNKATVYDNLKTPKQPKKKIKLAPAPESDVFTG